MVKTEEAHSLRIDTETDTEPDPDPEPESKPGAEPALANPVTVADATAGSSTSNASVSSKDAAAPAVNLFEKQPERTSYLSSLSPSQLKATTHPPTHSLQILAGPGSGKTRVLTSRVAWFILDPHNNINPAHIVVVTFTNKAANEMKSRLNSLIGPVRTANLIIGTFHATCAKYLRKYGQLIQLSNNFTIVDADDSKKMFKVILKSMEQRLKDDNLQIKPEQAMSEVSKAKAKDIDPVAYRHEALKSSASSSQQSTAKGILNKFGSSYKMVMADVYVRYQEELRRANALDFDDLLVYGVELFRQHPDIARTIEHVLVDEFQDTNTTQYMLMSLMAVHCRSISIVGDPDQSIYGWRSAEVGNLKKMCKDFKGTEQVRLEENYRSTSAILEASLKVVQQDRARVEKGLHTSHPRGPPVTLRWNSTAQREAWFIASEIKRIIAYSGRLLNFNDFAVLLRFNALSRAIEAEFQAQGIFSRMVGGHKFFDRMEVKDILGYLSLADNPGFTPAFVRVVNVPKRGIGENKIGDLRSQGHTRGLKPMEVAERVVSGRLKIPGIGPVLKKGLGELVGAVVELREMAQQRKPVSDLIEALLKRIDYESHLRKEPDFESRWENVKELISFAKLLETSDEQTAAAMLNRYEDGGLDADNGGLEEVEEDGDFVDPYHDDHESLLTGTPSTKAPSQPSQQSTMSQRSKGKSGPLKREQSDDDNEEVIDLVSSDEDDKSKLRTSRQPDTERVRKKAKQTFREAMLDRSSGSPSKTKRDDPDSREDLETLAIPVDDDDEDDEDEEEKTPLRIFLEASILATDTADAEDEDGKAKPKVTISTCHAAKGLEWPVVFVPSVEEGTYPAFRCEQPHEIDEECRLLYVAMTRAETMLYLCHSSVRMQGGETRDKVLSHFIESIAKPDAGGSERNDKKAIQFCTDRPDLDGEALDMIVKVTSKAKPEQAALDEAVRQFDKSKLARDIKALDGAEAYERRAESGGRGSYGGGGGRGGGGYSNRWNSGFSSLDQGVSLGRFSGSGSFAPSSSLGAFSNSNMGRSGSPASSHSSSGFRSGQVGGKGGGADAGLRQNLGFSRPQIGSYSSVLDDDDFDGSSNSSSSSSRGGAKAEGATGGVYLSASGLHNGGRTMSGSMLGTGVSGGVAGGYRTKRPLLPPSIQARQKAEREARGGGGGRQEALQPPRPPRFTDGVRLHARPEDAIEVASGRTDGMAPRRRADLESFQQAHNNSMTSLLDLLPANKEEAEAVADEFRAALDRGCGGGKEGGGKGVSGGSVRGGAAGPLPTAAAGGKRRLGMGMARRAPSGRGKR